MDRKDIASEASYALAGTANSLSVWLDDHYPNAEPGEIEEFLEITRCPTCDQWAFEDDLEDDEGNIGPCEWCRD